MTLHAASHKCGSIQILQRKGPVQTSNFIITCAEPNTYLGRPKLLSSTVDLDGRTLHVPNLIRGEKYHS